ncbi:hypothetical protein ACFVS9_20585 [Streptomyces sp. NPDC058008]|uniref:hypothetical protein n=1 Tax=Streptomyces sp. NPDC058008 TaxID=3346303 RepID=UPI0036E7305C
MRNRRWWSTVSSWAVWWAAITAAFWCLGEVVGQPASLAGCAASAVLVIAVGEVGDRARRRFRQRRSAD